MLGLAQISSYYASILLFVLYSYYSITKMAHPNIVQAIIETNLYISIIMIEECFIKLIIMLSVSLYNLLPTLFESIDHFNCSSAVTACYYPSLLKVEESFLEVLL